MNNMKKLYLEWSKEWKRQAAWSEAMYITYGDEVYFKMWNSDFDNYLDRLNSYYEAGQ